MYLTKGMPQEGNRASIEDSPLAKWQDHRLEV